MSIEVPEPPDIRACATCMEPLSWLWSYNREVWIAAVRGEHRSEIRLHRCKHAQDPPTWREIHTGEPPNRSYLEAKNKIKEQQR